MIVRTMSAQPPVNKPVDNFGKHMKKPNEIKPLLTPAEREEYEERAAILQFDGKIEFSRAEELALISILAKRAKNPPAQS